MTNMKRFFFCFSLLVAVSFPEVDIFAHNGSVKAWEGTIDLPTYIVNAPEKAPLFERDFAYQRAKRCVYPYAMNDNPTRIKVDSTYKALYIENDYVKVCVLPDLGGRLFYATDKTNGYEIFYRQHVIKPANVGMLGAWISGGVEWNVFHHHRVTSQMPTDYRIVDNGDGSKTIWVGEVERRHRMSWAIGLTLYPDKSYIEVTGRFFNDSEDRNSMLHWNNVATHANENYQIIFPENTEFGTFHHKNSFTRWPVSDGPYNGNPDFNGVDISYWKNLPALKGSSVFVYNLQDDYIGGYDYGKDAGTMLTGNHNINKGGKFWSWGHMNYGHAWDCTTLTDTDGAYVELMTSAYSDNQPDYCWINPYETKEFKAYWYGIRNLKHVNRGNSSATVNMDIENDGRIHLAANVTEVRNNARIEVTHGEKLLYSISATISPDRPFEGDIVVPADEVTRPSEVTMHLYSSEGEELISYHPYELDRTKPLPDPVTPLNMDPASIKNIEELYYVGMRNLQFHQAHTDPYVYFEEVLRRDPGDTRANTQMGIRYRKSGELDKAKDYLRKAVRRQTANETRTSDGEAMYNLGLVLKTEGKYRDAIDTLYRSAWDYEYASASYFQLAGISTLLGNRKQALDEARMAVNYNGMNMEARHLLATILRHEGKSSEAAAHAREVEAFDPVNHGAAYELYKLGKKSKEEFKELLRDESESYLELAVDYMNLGLIDDAMDILAISEEVKPYATIEYYQGYLADKEGQTASASAFFRAAEAANTDYVFPFRLETVKVYEKALEYMPESDVTLYYLGNLYYMKQPGKAMECWLKALEINPDRAMVLRNLGWAHRFYTEDLDRAMDYYKKAIEKDPSCAIFLAECDELMEHANAPLEERLNLFRGKKEVYDRRYDSETRAIKQFILAGEYKNVLEPLLTHVYSRREHVDDLHDIYVNACILSSLSSSDPAEALDYMLKANEYPENQGYLHLEYWARDAQVYYYTGLAYEKAGDSGKAREYYEMASHVEVHDNDDCVFNYEKALALLKLDPKAEVRPMFKSMLKYGRDKETSYVQRFWESFDRGPYEQDVNSEAYYIQGVAYKALGRDAKARKYFRKALSQRNDHVWANYYLGNIITQ